MSEKDEIVVNDPTDSANHAEPQETYDGLQDNPMRAKNPILTDDVLQLKSEVFDEKNSLFLVNEQKIKALWEKIGLLEHRVISEVRSLELGKTLIKQLEEARSFLLSDEKKFEEANALAVTVEYRLEFMIKVKKASRITGVPIFVYEIIWIIVLLMGLYFINFSTNLPALFVEETIFDPTILINSLIWGGFGGVVGALYALWKHIAKEQDFDAQFALWYITNPVLGVALGGFVYLLIQAGFLSLTAGAAQGEAIQSAAVIYVFSWICGFKQNVVYEIVRRVLDVFRVDDQDKGLVFENGQKENPSGE